MSTEKEQTTHNMASISLLRDNLLPFLLDDDEEAILYWAGKELARRYSVEEREDVKNFFSIYQLGLLSYEKEKNSQTILTLQGPAVEARFNAYEPNFSFEAGILAGFYQNIHNFYAEAASNIRADQKKVEIIISYDKKELIDN